MTTPQNPLDTLVEAIAERVAAKLGASGKQVLSAKEAAARLKCSIFTLRNLVAAGKLRVVALDERWRFDSADVDRLVEEAKG